MIAGRETSTMARHEDRSCATFVEQDYRPGNLDALLHIEAHAGDIRWTRDSFRWFLDRRNTAVCVITTSAAPRTPIAFHAVEENVDVVYLANIAVAPEWRRKSVATFALARIVDRARQSRSPGSVARAKARKIRRRQVSGIELGSGRLALAARSTAASS